MLANEDDGISPDLSTSSYTSVDDLLIVLSSGREVLLVTTDVDIIDAYS